MKQIHYPANIADFRGMLHLKKSLGQHFLKDRQMQERIAASIGDLSAFARVIEIGPGMGALTQHLVKDKPANFYVIELDDRWAAYQKETNAFMADRVIHQDFLKTDLNAILEYPTHIVGNFPYNISTEIVFRIIDYRDKITRMTGMFQKEVAVRIAAKPKNKDYGVTSVLTQAYYDAKYLFDVPPDSFDPPPKVMSGMLRLDRKSEELGCDEKLFRRVVKQAFTQRRKTMRNSLKQIIHEKNISDKEVFSKRPEELDVKAFVELTNLIGT